MHIIGDETHANNVSDGYMVLYIRNGRQYIISN